MNVVPVSIISASVLATCLHFYGFSSHQIACAETWSESLYLVHQDFHWHDAIPSLFSDSLTSTFEEVSQEMGAAKGSSAATSSCYTGSEEATEVAFMFHELYSRRLQDGSSEQHRALVPKNSQERWYARVRWWFGLRDSHVGTHCITELVISQQMVFNLIFSLTLMNSVAGGYRCFLAPYQVWRRWSSSV